MSVMEQDSIAVGPATKPSYKWTMQKQCLGLMPGGKIKAMDLCQQLKKYEQEKGLQVLILQATDMEILLKKTSLFTGPWKDTFPALGAPFCLLILVGSAGSPLDFVAVSQTCTLLSQAGVSLKSGPNLDALPEQALPTDWGTGTRTTLIGWFLWQPSY